MDVSLVIRQRLGELGLDQKDLATAAQVTESYISQLLARKKAPPAPGRTDIYEKIGLFLKLPSGELTKLADAQRHLEMKKKAAEVPTPLFRDCRQLILRKCDAASREEVQRVFEKEPFGELERLVTQTIVEVAQAVAREELRSEEDLRRLAVNSGLTYEELRVRILEFLDIDTFHVSLENCVQFLDPMIERWDIDLKTFAIEVLKKRGTPPGQTLRYEFQEVSNRPPLEIEPGFVQFLNDTSLSGDATEEEIEFLKALRFRHKRPAAIYYYRELQNLRDPLHFPSLQ